jgi:hypothetical protein
VIGTERANELLELVRGEDHRIEVDLLETARRRLRQRAVGIRTRAPGMIDTAAIGRQVAAAMHRQNLQPGMALEHPIENEVVQRNAGIERVADHVVEVEAAQSLRMGEPDGMDDDQGAERLRLLPERGKFWMRQFAPGGIDVAVSNVDERL